MAKSGGTARGRPRSWRSKSGGGFFRMTPYKYASVTGAKGKWALVTAVRSKKGGPMYGKTLTMHKSRRAAFSEGNAWLKD